MWSEDFEKELLKAEKNAQIKVVAEVEQTLKSMQELHDLTALWKKELKYVGLEIEKIFVNEKGGKQWVGEQHSAKQAADFWEQRHQYMQQINQSKAQNTTRNYRLTGKEKEQKTHTSGKAKTWKQLDLIELLASKTAQEP